LGLSRETCLGPLLNIMYIEIKIVLSLTQFKEEKNEVIDEGSFPK
jgi:hypothetical protein